jgi:hypothetical protein
MSILTRGFLTLCVVVMAFFAFSDVTSAALDMDNSYKGIVKIYTYLDDGYGRLQVVQSGSGVIISNDGTILTNYHVITSKDAFDKEFEIALKVCLTTNTTVSPVCKWSADVVAKDESLDIALIKIRNIGLSSRSDFEFLDRPAVQSFKDGDIVQSLGYPDTGGETITGAAGTITGTVEKFFQKWIKTSAYISYGSSGGALVDASGKLIGITTSKNSEVGYAHDIVDLKDWITANIGKQGVISNIQDRLNGYMTKEQSLTASNSFTNDLPKINFSKLDAWKYRYDGENGFFVYNDAEQESGFISIDWNKSDTYTEQMLDIEVKIKTESGNYFSAGNAMLGGKNGKKLIYHVNGEEVNLVILPSINYYVNVNYYYGKNDKNKKQVDDMLASLAVSDLNNNFVTVKSYEHKNPFFKINTSGDWSLMHINNPSTPVTGQNLDVPELSWSILIYKQTDEMKKMNNQEYFNYIKDGESIKSSIEG